MELYRKENCLTYPLSEKDYKEKIVSEKSVIKSSVNNGTKAGSITLIYFEL